MKRTAAARLTKNTSGPSGESRTTSTVAASRGAGASSTSSPPLRARSGALAKISPGPGAAR